MDTRDDGADARDGVDADRRGDGTDSNAGAGVTASAPGAADARTEESEGVGLAEAFETGGDQPPLEPLEPGTPTPENVFFVVLGALATVALFATAF